MLQPSLTWVQDGDDSGCVYHLQVSFHWRVHCQMSPKYFIFLNDSVSQNWYRKAELTIWWQWLKLSSDVYTYVVLSTCSTVKNRFYLSSNFESLHITLQLKIKSIYTISLYELNCGKPEEVQHSDMHYAFEHSKIKVTSMWKSEMLYNQDHYAFGGGRGSLCWE